MSIWGLLSIASYVFDSKSAHKSWWIMEQNVMYYICVTNIQKANINVLYLCDGLNSLLSVRLCRSHFITNVLYMAKWVSQLPSLSYDFNDFTDVLCLFHILEILYESCMKDPCQNLAIFYFISSPKLSHYRIKIQDPKLFWMCAEPWYPCIRAKLYKLLCRRKYPLETYMWKYILEVGSALLPPYSQVSAYAYLLTKSQLKSEG